MSDLSIQTHFLLKKPALYTFEKKIDLRGNLSFLEELKDVPFEVKRVYWLYDVPEQQVRGGHAHKTSEQVIICIKGQIKVLLESKTGEQQEFFLDDPCQGLYIPPQWWGRMVFEDQALMIGLASDEFNESDYIRNKANF